MVNWRLGWREMAALASCTGYAGIDLSREGGTGSDPQEVRAVFAEAGVRPVMSPLPVEYRKSKEEFDAGFATMKVAAELAARIGCTGMNTYLPSSTDWPKPEAWAILRDRLAACAEVLSGNGLRLAIEFLGPLHLRRKARHELVYRMGDALEFAQDCGHDAGLLLDSWHWHHSGGLAGDILAAGAKAIVHVHVADSAPLAPEDVQDMERLMPGQGVVDFVAFFGALRAAGYAGGVSPEVFSSRMKELTPEEGARLGAIGANEVMQCLKS